MKWQGERLRSCRTDEDPWFHSILCDLLHFMSIISCCNEFCVAFMRRTCVRSFINNDPLNSGFKLIRACLLAGYWRDLIHLDAASGCVGFPLELSEGIAMIFQKVCQSLVVCCFLVCSARGEVLIEFATDPLFLWE